MMTSDADVGEEAIEVEPSTNIPLHFAAVWQQRGNLCTWSKGVVFNSSVQKNGIPLTFIDIYGDGTADVSTVGGRWGSDSDSGYLHECRF